MKKNELLLQQSEGAVVEVNCGLKGPSNIWLSYINKITLKNMF